MVANGDEIKIPDNLSGLDGLFVGVIGFGTIGQAVAQAFRNLGCRIGYCDPAADASAARAIGASPMTFDEILAQADMSRCMCRCCRRRAISSAPANSPK